MFREAANDRSDFVTILICKNILLREGLKHLLENTCFGVSDTAPDETAPWRHHVDTRPALFIVDASNSSDKLLKIVELIKVRQPEAKIVLIADQFNVSFVRRGFAAGVDGFCSAANGLDVLIKLLELIMMGERILPGMLVHSLLSEMAAVDPILDQDSSITEALPPDPRILKLSKREVEILRCIMRGETNKVIARKLEVTEATIKVHVKAILRKIGLANRTQAAMWANQNLRVANQPSLNQ
jgi:two-component system, NarL family, nitrate/nitrite response regulator NarL